MTYNENSIALSSDRGTLELSGVNLMYEGTRVKSWLVGRDLNPAGRGDGSHYALGDFSIGNIRPVPTTTPVTGWGNSVNDQEQGQECGGEKCTYSDVDPRDVFMADSLGSNRAAWCIIYGNGWTCAFDVPGCPWPPPNAPPDWGYREFWTPCHRLTYLYIPPSCQWTVSCLHASYPAYTEERANTPWGVWLGGTNKVPAAAAFGGAGLGELPALSSALELCMNEPYFVDGGTGTGGGSDGNEELCSQSTDPPCKYCSDEPCEPNIDTTPCPDGWAFNYPTEKQLCLSGPDDIDDIDLFHCSEAFNACLANCSAISRTIDDLSLCNICCDSARKDCQLMAMSGSCN